MNKQRGFTIIELIVVIAIIAVLAAIVLVNVTQYIAKGKDASIKGNMSSMATMAAAWYDNPAHTGFLGLATEGAVLGDAAYESGIASIDTANGTGAVSDQIVAVTGSAWCVQSDLNDGTDWCVDSTGYKGLTAVCDAGSADCAAD